MGDSNDYCVCQHLYGHTFLVNSSNDLNGDYGGFDNSSDYSALSSESSYDFFDENFLNITANYTTSVHNWAAMVKTYTAYLSLILGMPANGLILFITLFNWHKRSASSWLVLNLALADLCLVLHAFFVINDKRKGKTRLIPDEVTHPRLMCSYKQGASHFFATVSFFSIAAIAFDRFYAIVRASVRNDNLGWRYAILYAVVWCSAFMLTLPIFYLSDVIDGQNNEKGSICVIKWTLQSKEDCRLLIQGYTGDTKCEVADSGLSTCEKGQFRLQKIYWSVFTIVGFIIPIFIIVTSYYFIMQKVKQTRKNVQRIGSQNMRERSNFARTIIIFFAATLISLTPYIIYQTIRLYDIGLSMYWCLNVKSCSEAFLLLSPLLNSVLYSFLGRKFRNEFKATFQTLFKCHSSKSKQNQTLNTESSYFYSRSGVSRKSRIDKHRQSISLSQINETVKMEDIVNVPKSTGSKLSH